jgi:dTDP-4-amino-4,6-dideoxygalactose transaminase
MSSTLVKVRFLDLSVPAEEKKELLAAADAVLSHGRLVIGPEVGELESQVAARVGRKFAIGVNSGTDALLLAFKAAGLGAGDEVITTSLSWLATASTVKLVGATPVFADIKDDLNIDPASVERLLTPKTKAILPVHYTGKVCDMPALLAIAKKHKLLVIEDASQAFDATLDGKRSGSFGDLGCFSMNPMKVFAALGEAGMVVTDDETLRDKLDSLRYHGTVNRERCTQLSWNGRLDTLQAAFLIKRLARLKGLVEKRRKIAGWYNEALKGVVRTPVEAMGERDVYYTYTIQADRRDELKAFLEAGGIETKIQHPILMPEQPVNAKDARGEWKNAARLRDRILCIPANEKIERSQVDYVAARIREFYGK